MQPQTLNSTAITLPYEGVINALTGSRQGLERVYEHFCDLTLRYMGHGEPLGQEEVAELKLLIDIYTEDETGSEVNNPLSIGDKVYFARDVRPYTVKAVGKQFAICTKPFNLKGTVLYTIIDFEEDIRGPNDGIFNVYDYTVQEDIDACLADLLDPESGVAVSCTRRRGIDLDLIKINNTLITAL